MATSRQRFGKAYLTLSRKIYFVICHRSFYATYKFIRKTELNFQLGKRRSLKVKSAGQNIKVSHKWTVNITIWAFVLSVTFSALTSGAEGLGLPVAIGVLLLIILLGILFDIIGVAVSTASEEPFHAMAAKKIPGAKESVSIIRSAQQISSLCNDVIGDIAGIISGAMTAAIVVSIAAVTGQDATLWSLGLAGLVAALMIGGKAAGKGVAMKSNNTVVFLVGRCVYYIKRLIPWRTGNGKNKKRV